jgi:hypothetical protein
MTVATACEENAVPVGAQSRQPQHRGDGIRGTTRIRRVLADATFSADDHQPGAV